MEKNKTRLPEIDGLRGLAIIQMIVYHLCYDLNYFGWAHFSLGRSPGWVIWQTSIVSTFLLLGGISLVLRNTFKPAWGDFWRRWGQIAGSALLVSLGSYWMFPESYIFFGILHLIAIALLLGRVLTFAGPYNLILGLFSIVLGVSFTHPIFNGRALSWIGFVTELPLTEDYVPIFPWLGVVLVGCAIGSLWKDSDFKLPNWIVLLKPHIPRTLTQMGKHSLIIYLAHQPVLLGTLFAFKTVRAISFKMCN